ncbi:hypothetical protein KEM48_000053 [Puccinia striiformis f. sp. tritici PST-130]|nr:hypothetical protein KEM48_000053 [Puccinia striiformis f. sp. tritici PST-130]
MTTPYNLYQASVLPDAKHSYYDHPNSIPSWSPESPPSNFCCASNLPTRLWLRSSVPHPSLADDPVPFHSGPTNRNFNSSSPILGPPAPPLNRSAHSDYFTPGSGAAPSAYHHHHPLPSPSLHHHHRTQSRSLSRSTNTNSPSPTRIANSHHTASNPMYAHRHQAGNSDRPSSPSARITNPLSGHNGIPLPRSRTQSSHSDCSGLPSQNPLNTNSNNVNRLRTDSLNSHHSTNSHGFLNGPSGLVVKPLGSPNEPQFTYNSSPTARNSTVPTNSSPSSIPPSGTIQGRPSSPSAHSLNPNTMVRRPSPLAQSTQSSPAPQQFASVPQSVAPDTPTRQPAPTTTSYRNSSASTVTITPSPLPITVLAANHQDEDVDEDSDTTSDVDHRPPGHRSTPGTSVDSSTSNFTQPEDIHFAQRSTALADRTPNKHSKHSLSNKLRRALSINALHENMIHESIPELAPAIGHERIKSSSASIAGVPLSPSINTNGKGGRQLGSSRRFGFLNSRSNNSTDNLSISSTVSSASVMIRKLGNLGKSARSKGVMGLTKIFKDKNDAAAGESNADDLKGFSSKTDRFKKSSTNQHKNLASTSVAHVQAEVDRSLSVEFPGMTPAAAFIYKQKQQYAEQEAAAAVAAAAAAEALNQARASESVRSKGRSGSVGSTGSLTPGSASEARKKMIEKEKEKIKNSVEDLRRAPENASDVEDNEDWDDNTVRGAHAEGQVDPSTGDPCKAIEELRDDEEVDEEALDEYDMESLFGNSSSNEGSSTRRTGIKPRPPKDAVPKKGILKNAQNFSQEQHLSPASFQSKPISAATTPDSPKPRTLVEDPSPAGLPQLAQSSQTAPAIDFGTGVLNLSLTLPAAEVKERRATFAQHLSVHTTWPPAIYDRRGELATCNRLTPTLAQRIKEEINAFKMEEMEVHHASRVHTHFFVHNCYQF